MPQVRLDLHEADGHLPAVCMVCGEPATVVRTKKLIWWPRWINLFFFVHPFLWGIIALIVSKRARLQAPFCNSHQGHWFNRSLLMWGVSALILLLAAAVLGTAEKLFRVEDMAAVFCYAANLGLFVLWVIVMIIVHNTTIRPRVITKSEIVIMGVSEAFVEAVQETDRQRLATGSDPRWENDETWEAKALPANKNQTPSDAIQEERPRQKKDNDTDEPQSRQTPPSDAIAE